MVEYSSTTLANLTLALLLISLATYYTVVVLIQEDGMWGWFAKLRLLVGMNREVFVNTAGVHDEESWSYVVDNVYEYKDEEVEDVRWVKTSRYFSQVFSCHRCLAPYIALVLSVIYLVGGLPFILLLAIAGATVYLKEK